MKIRQREGGREIGRRETETETGERKITKNRTDRGKMRGKEGDKTDRQRGWGGPLWPKSMPKSRQLDRPVQLNFSHF